MRSQMRSVITGPVPAFGRGGAKPLPHRVSTHEVRRHLLDCPARELLCKPLAHRRRHVRKE